MFRQQSAALADSFWRRLQYSFTRAITTPTGLPAWAWGSA